MKLLLGLIFLVTLDASAQGDAGGAASVGTRGGGSGCALDFIRLGKYIHDQISRHSYYQEKLPLEELRDIIERSPVMISETELRNQDGYVLDAQNDPATSTIYVSKSWCQHRDSAPNPVLVFHEYLGLLNPEIDRRYQLSALLYEVTGLNEESFINLMRSGGVETRIVTLGPFQHFLGTLDENLFLKKEEGCVYPGMTSERVVVNCQENGGILKIQMIQAPARGSYCSLNSAVEVVNSETYFFKGLADCKTYSSMVVLKEVRAKLTVELGVSSRAVISFGVN